MKIPTTMAPFAQNGDGRHHRCREGALPRAFLAFDLDGGTEERFVGLSTLLWSYSGLGYTTASHKGGTYQQAVNAVLAADPELEKPYAAPAAASARPDKEVHTRTLALMAENPHLDYQEAMGSVLNADPALKAAYARS